jgi:hypothetical protein
MGFTLFDERRLEGLRASPVYVREGENPAHSHSQTIEISLNIPCKTTLSYPFPSYPQGEEEVSTTKRVTLASAVAVLLAVTLIATAVLTGSLPGVHNVNTGQAGTGTLSIMLTDPPIIPTGVTAVYVSYSNLTVHVSEAGNQSGWYPVNSQGTIELLGSVNISQTLGTVTVASGNYNLIRFNVTSAKVTYNGVNYTAFVPSSELTVPIIGGVKVTNSKPSATIIDLQTTVMNIGSHSNPEFMIRPVVKAYPVPSSDVTVNMQHKGFRQGLRNQLWWTSLRERYTANLQITTASLTASSLSLSVKNSGNHSTILSLVTLSPLAVFLGGRGEHPGSHLTDSLLNSATFLVLKNGSLVPLRNFAAEALAAGSAGVKARGTVYKSLFATVGYNLTVESSATFTFSGHIVIGYPALRESTSSMVVSGQQYVITALGTKAVASTVVMAG